MIQMSDETKRVMKEYGIQDPCKRAPRKWNPSKDHSTTFRPPRIAKGVGRKRYAKTLLRQILRGSGLSKEEIETILYPKFDHEDPDL
jgi:hypothetical protein